MLRNAFALYHNPPSPHERFIEQLAIHIILFWPAAKSILYLLLFYVHIIFIYAERI